MATSNRATLINDVYKVLKKHYQPVTTVERNLMENLLYACCLEDATYAAADDCYARLQESYFDWNEVRVTTVRELGEIFSKIPNSTANALNLKNTLQSVFEAHYTFDLEHLKKQNLGKTVSMLTDYKGTTQFSISYVTQRNLGGHAIPLGKGGIDIMYIVGVITEKEAATGAVPGLERAIPKTKGPEFGSLLHQFAAELVAAPFSQKVKGILLEMNPDCKERLPKRIDKKKIEAERKKAEDEARKKKQAEEKAIKKKEEAERKAEEKAAAKEVAKKEAAKKAELKAKEKEKADKKKAAAEAKKAAKKKATTKKAPPAKKKAAKKTPEKKKLVKKAAKKTSKKSASKQLARRKPR